MDQTRREPGHVPREALRTAVGRLRRQERRARFDATLHLGSLDGFSTAHEIHACDVPDLDAGTRTDLVARLLEDHSAASGGNRPAAVWLTRPGDPLPQDVDLAWMAATRLACAQAGLPPPGFWVVTRTGWLDLSSGEHRTWARLRLRDG